MNRILVDVALATIPMVALAALTWRLVWPKWKLVVKLLLHPCIYAILSFYIGHWSVAVAWVHQGSSGWAGTSGSAESTVSPGTPSKTRRATSGSPGRP